MKNLQYSPSGYTVAEVLVVIAMIGVISAIAAPSVTDWLRNAQYREAASGLAAAAKNARSRAISKNHEHRVEIDLSADRYRITRGNRPYNSTDTSFDANVVVNWTAASPLINLKGNDDCSVVSGTVTIEFNPNGTGDSQYICITDKSDEKKYRTGVSNSTTGRVVVEKYPW